MLASVATELARRFDVVSVVARTPSRLDRLVAAVAPPGRINPVPVDYRDSDALVLALAQAVSELGPFELAVVWIHSTAPDAAGIVGRFVTGPYFHVLSSAGVGLRPPDDERRREPAVGLHHRYHEVVLGFTVDHGRSRWLTDDEITAGVLTAIRTGDAKCIVGTLDPWDGRP